MPTTNAPIGGFGPGSSIFEGPFGGPYVSIGSQPANVSEPEQWADAGTFLDYGTVDLRLEDVLNTSCPICLNALDEPHASDPTLPEERVVITPCNHIFHVECLAEWFEQDRNTCPMCRRIFFPAEDEDEDEEEFATIWQGQQAQQSVVAEGGDSVLIRLGVDDRSIAVVEHFLDVLRPAEETEEDAAQRRFLGETIVLFEGALLDMRLARANQMMAAVAAAPLDAPDVPAGTQMQPVDLTMQDAPAANVMVVSDHDDDDVFDPSVDLPDAEDSSDEEE